MNELISDFKRVTYFMLDIIMKVIGCVSFKKSETYFQRIIFYLFLYNGNAFKLKFLFYRANPYSPVEFIVGVNVRHQPGVCT